MLGEAGSGKTHLIGRLIEQSQSVAFPYSFAYILPFIDAGQGFRYLLCEIINNLTHTYAMGAKHSQFDFLDGPPRWGRINALLETFLKLGGVTLFLNQEYASCWYAMARLQFDIQTCDISAPGVGVIRFDYLKRFMASLVDGDTYPAFKALDRYLTSDNRNEVEILKTPT